MSNGLVKQMFMTVQEGEKRVINADELIQRRKEKHAKWAEESSEGFVSGLDAEEYELAAAGEDGEVGNIIKPQESADQILENARAAAEATLAGARAEAESILEEARAQAEAERGEVLAQAQQQGYSEGHEKAEQEADVIRREYQEKERQLEHYYEQQIKELEPQMVDTISAIYEHIFHVELESYRDILGHLILDTLRKMEGVHDFMIHVSQEDYPYVSMQKKQLLEEALAANCNVDVVEDMTLSRNECMIETDSGIYDCGLGTQLEALKKRLMVLAFRRE